MNGRKKGRLETSALLVKFQHSPILYFPNSQR
ncbi:MAG: hypothetical protein [Siphoviridae sp. ctjeG17]|nr:MAG: hypothetical protein [Siphoviridae sp. ctjeG17]